MKHARADYNHIQDSNNKIGEDEPVMLFRAQDEHFIKVLEHYFYLLESDENGNNDLADSVAQHMELSEEWREKNEHLIKTPDL